MDTLHAVAAVLTDWLLETTVHVAVLFALVLGASTLLGRRLPVRWRHALWALVLVRLLLPALPSSPASVHNVANVVVPAAGALVERPVDAAPTRVSGPARVAQLVPSVAATPRTPVETPWPWRSSVAIVWLAGAAVALGRLIVAETSFARAVRREPVCDDARVRAALSAVLAGAGIRRAVEVVRTDLGDGPALTGVLRPRILLPGRVLDDLNDDELRHVLAHEVAHLAAGDVLQNWLLAVLESLHWFDPLVRVASGRLRTERESLRDLAATKGTPREGRSAYGRTLLRLLETGPRRAAPRMAVGLFERRGELRRRIEMIAKGGGGRRGWILGAGLTAVVAAVALTGASPRTADAQEESAGAVVGADGRGVPGARVVAAPAPAPQQRRIEVVRRSEPPEWEERVRAGLAKKTAVNLAETSVADLVEYMSRVTALNFVIHPDAQEAAAEPTITLSLESVSAEQALRLALRQAEMTFGVVDGVVQVGHFHSVRPSLEQRFYKIAPLIDASLARVGEQLDEDERESYRRSMPEDVIMLCQSYVGDQDVWTRTGVSMAMWGDVVVVEQDAATHAQMEDFLNMLLTRGASVPPAPEWRTALETKLGTKVSFDFKDAALDSVVAYLAQSTGVSMVVAPDAADEVTLSLKLTDVTALEAINWVARQTRLHAAFSDGAVVLTRTPSVVLRAYDLSEKFAAEEGVPADALIELITTSVAPATWEEFGSVEYWDEMLIVRNTEDVHAQITDFLVVARKALDK